MAAASAFNDDVDSNYLQASISGMAECYENLHDVVDGIFRIVSYENNFMGI